MVFRPNIRFGIPKIPAEIFTKYTGYGHVMECKVGIAWRSRLKYQGVVRSAIAWEHGIPDQ